MASAKQQGNVLSGSDAFKLYDTYGFPIELTEEITAQEGITIDNEGFEHEMHQQRERARAARQKTQSMQVQNEVLGSINTPSKFVGYDVTETQTEITDIIFNGELVDEVESGENIQFILRETPFYAVSGGQVADKGIIRHDQFEIEVTEVIKAPNGQNLHAGHVTFGQVHVGETVEAIVNKDERKSIIKTTQQHTYYMQL